MTRPTFSFCILLVTITIISVKSDSDDFLLRLPSSDRRGGIWAEVGPASCPVKCFRPDPVCGDDGVTYWCGCADAACGGATVAKLGFCEVGSSGGNGPVSGQALLLVQIVWLILLGVFVLFGFL